MFDLFPGGFGGAGHGLAPTATLVLLCVVQIAFLARTWLRVTARDQDATRHRRRASALDWTGSAVMPLRRDKARWALRR
jgi:hypothetical protein